jgi:CRISPR-associated exonuclease Cas4
VDWRYAHFVRVPAYRCLAIGGGPMMENPLIFGLLAAIFGLLLIAWALRTRKNRGLGAGKTEALDDLVLVSQALKLVGRPDRITRQGEFLIPEEWKPSARRIYPGHRLQVIAYCLLVEEHFGVRPPHGVVVLAGGKRVEVPNTEELQAEVLTVAARIREHRQNIREEIPVRQPAAKCCACGQLSHCRQRAPIHT